jgi:hypothetical protein
VRGRVFAFGKGGSKPVAHHCEDIGDGVALMRVGRGNTGQLFREDRALAGRQAGISEKGYLAFGRPCAHILFRPTRHDPERAVRERPLQRQRLGRWRRHP